MAPPVWEYIETYRGFRIEHRYGGKRVHWRYERENGQGEICYVTKSSLEDTRRAVDTFVRSIPSMRRD